jgi:hypothetical protein
MENLKKEFRRYATKHKGINGTTVDAVIDYQVARLQFYSEKPDN